MKSLLTRFVDQRFRVYAILLALLFFGVHLLGFREYTGILSGTASLDQYNQYYGVLYILLYVNFVVTVPILLIASVLTEIWTFFMLKEK